MRVPKHVSGLLISLWEPANSLFVRDKYVTPTGKRLHAGYVQKAELYGLYIFLKSVKISLKYLKLFLVVDTK